MSTQVATNEPATLTEAILGKELINAPIFSKVRAWPAELRAALASVLLASLVLLPYLGAVGLWDPWEVHYGEVAREMIQRNDYVHPYWENAWFFSKPAFTMWMQALGLQAAELGPVLALLLAGAAGRAWASRSTPASSRAPRRPRSSGACWGWSSARSSWCCSSGRRRVTPAVEVLHGGGGA